MKLISRKTSVESGRNRLLPRIRAEKSKMFLLAAMILAVGFFVFAAGGNFLTAKAAGTETSDAIAIRVMPNSEHYSPLVWYYNNVNLQGSPQSLSVDGYEAVRDGRTVYVNAANAGDASGDGKYESYYTNIYIISYNQDANQATADIFGQVLAHWKFNVNLMEASGAGECKNSGQGTDCSAEACPAGYVCADNGGEKQCVIKCVADADCPAGDYCLSKKAKIVRDTVRLSDLADIKINLSAYYNNHDSYPKLESGTYLKGRTVSTWPSWQDNFAVELGAAILAVDPVNKMGPCEGEGFNSETCWNEADKKFFTADFSMPEGSNVFYYKTDDGSAFALCTVLESATSDFIPDALNGLNCAGN